MMTKKGIDHTLIAAKGLKNSALSYISWMLKVVS